MKKYFSYLFFVLGVSPIIALAEDFSSSDILFQPRAYMGYADYTLESGTMTYTPEGEPSFEQPLEFDGYPHDKIDFNGFLWGLGATVAKGPIFADVYYQSTLDETVYSSGEQQLSPRQTLNLGNVDAKHWDCSLSLGYQINPQWSVFAGYKSGKTDWDQVIRINESPPQSVLQQQGNFAVKFEQDGPFIGTSYSFLIGLGALTLKGAYAYLDGSYTSNFNGSLFPDRANVPITQNFSWDGDSNAFSFGVSWTQALTDNLGLSVGANYHRYKFDTSGAKEFTSTVDGEVVGRGRLDGGDLTEELFTLTASLVVQLLAPALRSHES